MGAFVILHDLNLAGAFADRVVIIHEGQIVANDIASRALTGKTLSHVFGVDMNVVRRGGASRIVLGARPSNF